MTRCLLRAISASLAAALCLSALAGAVTDAPLTLLVFDRPPYYHLVDGKPAGGFLLTITLAVLDRAGLPYSVREMPPGRILATLESENRGICAVGWLQTPERKAFARFSHPIYYNKPLGVAVSAAVAKEFPVPPRLGQLLQKHWNWGLRLGFSYGPALDAAFATAPKDSIHRFSDPGLMLRLLAKGRLDAVVIEPEELAWLLHQEPQLADVIRLVPLADAPPRLARSIMCDADVSQAVMGRIDAAIDAFMGPTAERARLAFARRH